MISFGNMINGARLELAREPVVWWQLAAAFLFMFVLVLAANLFADQVRDALDPKSKGAHDANSTVENLRVEIAAGGRTLTPVDGVSFESAPMSASPCWANPAAANR
jgi:hypothetical protein